MGVGLKSSHAIAKQSNHDFGSYNDCLSLLTKGPAPGSCAPQPGVGVRVGVGGWGEHLSLVQAGQPCCLTLRERFISSTMDTKTLENGGLRTSGWILLPGGPGLALPSMVQWLLWAVGLCKGATSSPPHHPIVEHQHEQVGALSGTSLPWGSGFFVWN